MINNWNWPGARWWKFDFHTHTPASHDYGKGPNQATLKQRTPEQWIQDFVDASIECVAVTDHNTGAWIDPLKQAVISQNLQERFFLFPGVEISVHGGIHILAIFDQEKTSLDIDYLLRSVDFDGTRGNSDGVTRDSATQVVDKIIRAGGLAIPAHVDDAKGLFREFSGQTLAQVLDNKNIIAMELCNQTVEKPALYRDKGINWTEVLATDAHHPTGTLGDKLPGSHYTWVKMGQPNLEGLRLALLDGDLSIKRSDTDKGNPNQHANQVIESLTIEKARYLGRAQEFECHFNPWLNTIIGSRGTGKSTLLEFMRLLLRRENELPDSLEEDFKKYQEPYKNKKEPGLLTNDTKLSLIYRTDGTRYRLNWQTNVSDTSIEKQTESGEWIASSGEIAQRFPARIYSQKQIFELADPLALLKVIDDSSGFNQWQQQWDELEKTFFSLRAQAREKAVKLQQAPRLHGELDDVKRKLAVFEKSDHAHVLQAYQKTQRQLHLLESWENSWRELGGRIRTLASELEPGTIETEEAEFLSDAQKLTANIQALLADFEALATQADNLDQGWQTTKQNATWYQAWEKAQTDYQALQTELQNSGVNITDYGRFLQEEQRLETELQNLESLKQTVEVLNRQADDELKNLKYHRRLLTENRKKFLEQTLSKNRHVKIEVIGYGECQYAVESFREVIQRPTGLDREIGGSDENSDGLVDQLYSGDGQNLEQRLHDLKQSLNSNNNSFSGWLTKHLQRFRPEDFDRIDIWFPPDSLDVSYSKDGKSFQPISQGSPGQKTAALLAFFLSYGDEPLILDQPEDDLDNQLIYSMIVEQLREIKTRRQVIIVTHNANIVVNGDAELVISLDAVSGQTMKKATGCLQEKPVRKEICEVMEGGTHAFTRRYQRITES